MNNKLSVVKIGGNIINDEAHLKRFLKDFASLKGAKILIHGGGVLATDLANQLGIEAKLVDGRRITTQENLDIVTMVYAGLISKKITAQLQSHACNAIGLAGCDANVVLATKRPIQPINFGEVGDVKAIHHQQIQSFLAAGITPVFSAICHDGLGHLLNTNADTITAEIAIAMQRYYETSLYYCFEKPGVLADVNDNNSVLNELTRPQFDDLKSIGKINKGMLPKLDNSFYALANGVKQVKVGNASMIVSSKNPHTNIVL